MDRQQVFDLIEESIDQMCTEADQKSVPHDERFGVARRALDRGIQRIDQFGSAIVNEPTPQSEGDVKRQIAWYFSGIIQCAAAAGMMLRDLPDLPKGVSMKTIARDVTEESDGAG